MYCFKAKRNALSSQHFLSSNLTVGSSVSVQAGAFVSAVAVVARAAVLAGFGIALVDVVLAVVARESRRAQAREGVDAIHARAAIEAGAAGRKCWRSLRVRKGYVYESISDIREGGTICWGTNSTEKKKKTGILS